jgi:hypothetical protein
MPSLKEIRKMELAKLTLSRECRDWIDIWLRDIMERNACTGDLYVMLREAYVLGARHAQIGQEEIDKRKAA